MNAILPSGVKRALHFSDTCSMSA